MIVSTKGRYALRVMVHFAQRGNEGYIPLKEIAEAEGISQKSDCPIFKLIPPHTLLVILSQLEN